MSRYKLRIRKFINNFIKLKRNYIELRLPVEDITKEFEDSLRSKIEHNILKAEIREATKDDADSLIKLHDKAWHSTTMPFHLMSKKRLLELLDDPEYVFLIANIDSTDGAFVIIYLTGADNYLGVIGALGVIPEFQHKGLGTILGIASWDFFISKGVKELGCKVHFDNKASFSFIKALGFKEIETGIEGPPSIYKF